MTVGGIIIAAIIASVFAFLIYRLASAHFKNKLRPEASDDRAYGDWPFIPNDALATPWDDGGNVLNAQPARKRQLRAGAGLRADISAEKAGNATLIQNRAIHSGANKPRGGTR